MDLAENKGKGAAQSRPETWDIHVDAGITENSVEYKPNHHVIIRANSIDYALSLVQRGRELMAKYS